MSDDVTLLAVPNVSEGRDAATVDAIAAAFTSGDTSGAGTRLLDHHSDADHHRTVFTLAGHPGTLAQALLAGAQEAVQRIDVGDQRLPAEIGKHPHVGAIDVVPIVYLDTETCGAACAEALVVADAIGEQLSVPVFLYGQLTGAEPGSARTPTARTRADLRRGGVPGLAARIAAAECRPDFGPARMHPTAGATLVAARPPLVAFNLELAAPATVEDARRIAALIREGGAQGLPGLRAIGVELTAGVALPRGDAPAGTNAQVSMNVERPLEVPLAAVVEAVRRHAEVARAELVGLAPRAAFEGFPTDLPIPGFDPASHLIENALGL